VSKTPRGSSTSSQPQVNAYRAHQIELAEWIKERDANPVTIPTVFGTWSSGKGGLGSHTEWTFPSPQPVRSKRKYRPGT
jgi:hypothetical protein